MQTSLHILSLVDELRHEILGGKIVNTEFYKKERTACFFIRKGSTLAALTFVYHPSGPGFFVVPASKLKIETREKPWPIFDLHGGEVTAVEQLGLDRIFYLDVTREQETHRVRVLFEAIGPNGNIWLLDDQWGKQAVLRNREFVKGEKYEPSAPPPDKLNPFEITPEVLRQRLAHSHSPSLTTWLERNILGFNRTLAKEICSRSDLTGSEFHSLDDVSFERLAIVIQQTAEKFREPAAGCLYTIAGAAEVYPFKLSFLDEPAEKFKTLSLAVMAMVSRRQTRVEEADEKKTTLDIVSRAIDKMGRRIAKLEEDIKQAADFESYKKLGDLLHINYDKIKRGMISIAVTDVYSEPHDQIEIPLDSALTPKDNVESYFKKHRKGREGLELLERRLSVSRDELAELERISGELETNFEQSIEKYRNELAALLPRESRSEIQQPRLPYREYKLSTGVTIFVGRDGSDNDRTTFEFAKPFELWFHTQQCAGSHVVLKFPNKSFEPSKREIEETASIAAFFSKAKNDSLVPVAYTERRYVRKPRNAKPGLVIVEREKSVMVEPKKPA